MIHGIIPVTNGIILRLLLHCSMLVVIITSGGNMKMIM
jgi:hypothetical protein